MRVNREIEVIVEVEEEERNKEGSSCGGEGRRGEGRGGEGSRWSVGSHPRPFQLVGRVCRRQFASPKSLPRLEGNGKSVNFGCR